MAYTINLTNGNVFAVIADGTVNTSSSMTLIGKNYAGYGQFADDNWIRLLESGANGTAPTAPLTGQLWFNTISGSLQVYNGTNFKTVGGATSSGTAPANPAVGDLWFDSANQQLKVWTGSAWLLVGPPYSSGQGITGSIPMTIVDTLSASHTVLAEYVGNTIVSLISKDSTFTPQTPVTGFATVNPGFNLSSTVGNAYYWGTASNSALLGGVAASQFMRSDIDTTTTGTLGVANNGGMTIGASNQFVANVSSVNTSNVALTNIMPNGNIDIRVNVGGTYQSAININGSTGAVSIPGLASGVTTIIGTANQIIASAATGAVTLSTPQDIANTSNVQFGSFGVGVAASGTAGDFKAATETISSTSQINSLGVGVAASGTAGEILATNNVTAFYASDAKFKENIQDIESPLAKVSAIGGKTFDWTDAYIQSHGGEDGYFYRKSDFGVIAQDVQAVFPTAVRTRRDGSLAVDYEKLSALAFAAVKELNAKVDALIAKLDI